MSSIPSENFAPRPTMRQIASAAGVSVMTVSRALRDSSLVTAAVRERIRKIADELGYRPDPQLAKLMKHLRRHHKPSYLATLAAITSVEESRETLELRKTCQSAQARAEALGYRLEIYRVKEPAQFNRSLQRTLVARGIEGVLLLQMTRPCNVDALLDWEKFSAVTASPSIVGHSFPHAGANYFHNAQLLCSRLARLGRRRIGFVATDTFCIRTSHAFSAGAAWQNIESGAQPIPPLIATSRLPARDAVLRWFRDQRPDAVIAHSNEAVCFLEEQLAGRGGGRVLLACTNVDPATTRFPGIDERHEMIGRNAVDLLTGLVARGEKSPRAIAVNTMVNGLWVGAGLDGADGRTA